MKAFINLTCMCLFMASCKEPEIKGVVVDTEVNLIIKNKDGKNLLDPSTPDHFTSDEIRLFYLKDGQKTEVYYPNLDHPRNFFISQNESNKEYFMRVFVNEGTLNQELTTTYIQWRANQVDTLQSMITRQGASVYSDKVWYDKVLKYDVSKNSLDMDWGNGRFRRLIEITQGL